MKRIGIFGGSFSPPHLGHLAAAGHFLADLGLDRLLIVPSAIPPHKESLDLPSGEHRLALCERAFSALPRTLVSDIEIRRAGKSYTYLTLRELSDPNFELYFLCGADMLLSLDTWMCPDVLFSLAIFVALSRSDDPIEYVKMLQKRDALARNFGARIIILRADPLPLSSSEIRAALAEGRDVSQMLSPSVIDYIKQWKLYE